MTLLPPSKCLLVKTMLSIGFLYGCGTVGSATTNDFRLQTRTFAIPERRPVLGYVLQTAKGRFSFLPPKNWAVKENAETREVVMMARNLITSIRFRVIETETEATKEARLAQWRQLVQADHPDGKITAEFPCYTSKIEGTAFDLERLAPNKTRVFTRLAFVPLPSGRAEFDLTTTDGDLADIRLAFGNFLTSFRVEPLATQ